MLRFLKLQSESGSQVDYLDLGSVVHVRETSAGVTEDEVLEVVVHFVGGASVQLAGQTAAEFLKQFQAYAERLNLHSGGSGPSGPGHSALSP
jgi:hypothetical protein